MIRKPDYLSPSSLKTWEEDRREYYIRYLSVRVPRPLQTVQMALGSAFDGLVKNEIERRYGLTLRDYTAQVEAHQRDAVAGPAQRIMDWYMPYVGRLLIVGEPHCETDLGHVINYKRASGVVAAVPLRGKPDLWWGDTMHDWKVNGFYSEASPAPGYRWDSKSLAAWKGRGAQAMLQPTAVALPWMDQLITYSWMVPNIKHVMVHQLTQRGGAARLTEYWRVIDNGEAEALRGRYIHMWESIITGRVFTDLTPEADTLEQQALDRVCAGLAPTAPSGDAKADALNEWFTTATRGGL